MFVSQSMEEYMENPMGRGSTAIGNRSLIKKDLDSRYDILLKRYKDFEHHQYAKDGHFYIHILIPSETKRENTYDVILELFPSDESVKVGRSLKQYDFRVFSNCPSFVYTYAYVYNQYGLLIPGLSSKYSDITLDTQPGTKNPGEVINYDKSIYFACKYITSHNSLMSTMLLIPQCRDLKMKSLLETIRSSDTIMLEIKKEDNRLKEEELKKQRNSKKPVKPEVKTKPRGIEKQTKQTGRTGTKTHVIPARKKLTPKAKIKPR